MGFCCTISSQHKCLSGNIKAVYLATGFAESKPEHKVSSSRTSLQLASQQIRMFSYYDLVPSATESREVHPHGGGREDPVGHTHSGPWGSSQSHSQWTGQAQPNTQEGGSEGTQRKRHELWRWLSPSAMPLCSILVLISQPPRFSLRASHFLCSQPTVFSHYLVSRGSLMTLTGWGSACEPRSPAACKAAAGKWRAHWTPSRTAGQAPEIFHPRWNDI